VYFKGYLNLYNMPEIFFKEESYKIIGLCMEVHKTLGMGFKEATYKEALELELQDTQIPYQREKRFKVVYKKECFQVTMLPISLYSILSSLK
jgi:GxxExxY protein